jgi:peptidoglycan/xylan/chitin deacetylase (PgdA/CDA1 family)
MQEKNSEALENQRRRRKRIGRIRNGIMITIAGWILISLVLILVLFWRIASLESKLDQLLASQTAVTGAAAMAQGVSSGGDGSGESVASGTELAESYYSGVDAVQTRTVDINEGNLAAEGDSHKVYLTFDGIPSENTAQILDILAEYDVKATFFVSASEDDDAEDYFRRIVEEGHTIGMHSYSNKYSVIYQSQDAFEEDYRKLYQYIYDLTGVSCRYYRFLGGSSNQISNVPMGNLIDFLNQQGVVYFDWNVSSGDEATNAYTADEIVSNVTEDVAKYKTSVVLLHDTEDQSTTVAALGSLIEALQGMDAEILPIDENTRVIQYVKADDSSADGTDASDGTD